MSLSLKDPDGTQSHNHIAATMIPSVVTPKQRRVITMEMKCESFTSVFYTSIWIHSDKLKYEPTLCLQRIRRLFELFGSSKTNTNSSENKLLIGFVIGLRNL